ncbi:hypothetical protein Tco_1185034 [Tanacetum coccineum]
MCPKPLFYSIQQQLIRVFLKILSFDLWGGGRGGGRREEIGRRKVEGGGGGRRQIEWEEEGVRRGGVEDGGQEEGRREEDVGKEGTGRKIGDGGGVGSGEGEEEEVVGGGRERKWGMRWRILVEETGGRREGGCGDAGGGRRGKGMGGGGNSGRGSGTDGRKVEEGGLGRRREDGKVWGGMGKELRKIRKEGGDFRGWRGIGK